MTNETTVTDKLSLWYSCFRTSILTGVKASSFWPGIRLWLSFGLIVKEPLNFFFQNFRKSFFLIALCAALFQTTKRPFVLLNLTPGRFSLLFDFESAMELKIGFSTFWISGDEGKNVTVIKGNISETENTCRRIAGFAKKDTVESCCWGKISIYIFQNSLDLQLHLLPRERGLSRFGTQTNEIAVRNEGNDDSYSFFDLLQILFQES